MEHAAHHACHPAPAASTIAVLGGGPVAHCAPHGAAPLPHDPTLVALSAWSGHETAGQRASVRAQLGQVASQLALLLNAGIGRLSSWVPARGEGGAQPAAPGAPALDAAPVPLQPPAPPLGPTLTLHPDSGIIDVPEGFVAPVAPGVLPDDADSGDGSHTPPPIDIGVPTGWMPFVGRLRPSSLRRDLRSLMERIDALLSESGVSRLQLLVAMIVVPVATAFLIDVVATLLEGR